MYDIKTAKSFLGIPAADTAQDAAIEMIMGYTLDAVETMLQRRLLLARQTDRFYEPSDRIFLTRWPIKLVYSVNGKPPPYGMTVHHTGGWIRNFDCWGYLPDAGCQDEYMLEVVYHGGYETLPPALERVLWEAFMLQWGSTDKLTGAPGSGGGAVVTQGSGDVSRVTIQDFGSVSFDVGSSVHGGESKDTGTVKNQLIWGWLAPWASTLEFYRRGDIGAGLGVC